MGDHLINKDMEAEQVEIESPDLTAAVIQLPERLIFSQKRFGYKLCSSRCASCHTKPSFDCHYSFIPCWFN